jgi:hypothetical protein
MPEQIKIFREIFFFAEVTRIHHFGSISTGHGSDIMDQGRDAPIFEKSFRDCLAVVEKYQSHDNVDCHAVGQTGMDESLRIITGWIRQIRQLSNFKESPQVESIGYFFKKAVFSQKVAYSRERHLWHDVRIIEPLDGSVIPQVALNRRGQFSHPGRLVKSSEHS